jgi:hypothetical protein
MRFVSRPLFAVIALGLPAILSNASFAEDPPKDELTFKYEGYHSAKRQKSLADAGYLSESTLTLAGRYTISPLWQFRAEASLFVPFENAGDNARGFVLTEPELGLLVELTYGKNLKFGFDIGGSFGEEEFGKPIRRRRALTADREVIFLDYAPFGRIDIGTIGGAMGEKCIEAPGALDVFGPADITTISTCPGFAEDDTILYTSPAFLGGWTVAASYSDAVRRGRLDDEAASQSATAGLFYTFEDGPQAINASFAVEQVFNFTTPPDHGQDDLFAVQAGFTWKQGAWEWGASTAFTAIDAKNENEWALQLGTTYQATDKLKIGGGVLYGRYGEIPKGGKTAQQASEIGATLVANYKLVPDRVAIELGGTVLQKLEPVRKTDWQIGFGLVVTFDTKLAGG